MNYHGVAQPTGLLTPTPEKVGLALGLAALAQALTGNPGLTGPIPTGTLMAGGMLSVVGALALWWRGWRAVSGNGIPLLLLALAGAISLSGALCLFLAQLGMASLIGFVGALLTFQLLPNSQAYWRGALTGILILCLFSNFHGLLLFYQTSEPLRSTFTNPDCYGGICLVGLFAALALATECSTRWRWAYAAACLIPFVALTLTGSRSGLIALASGYAGFLFTLASSRSEVWRGMAVKLFVVPAALLLLLVVAGSSLQVSEKWSRLLAGQDQASYKTRLDALVYGCKTVMHSPLTGSGLNCFPLAYQQDRPAILPSEDYVNVAHNDYLQWTVETGIIGGFAWSALLLVSLRLAWRSYRAPTPWVAGQLGTTLAVAVFIALNPLCPIPGILLWLGASLGLTGSLANLSRPVEPSPWQPRIFPLALLLACAGLWGVNFGWNCYRSQRLQLQAEQLERVLDWEGAVMFLESAGKYTPDDPEIALQLARLCRRIYVLSGKSNWLENEEAALLRARGDSPRNLMVLVRLANAYEDRGRVEEAGRYSREASEYAPYSPAVRKALVRNLLFAGKVEEAAEGLASIEATGQVIDDRALGELVYWLEKKKSGEGLAYLHKVGPERALVIGLEASSVALDRKQFAVATRLLKELEKLAPKEPRVVLQRAKALGLAGKKSQELQVIETLRRNGEIAKDDELMDRVWRIWSELRMGEKQYELVAAQLEDYLITHPRRSWARSQLSQIHLTLGRKAEARAALREGTPYDTDGSLRLELGDLCAAQGLPDLARSYYREALAVSPNRNAVEERLKRLKAPSQDELDFLETPAPEK